MRPFFKHTRVSQHVRYNRSCHNTSKSLPWFGCRCNITYKTTNTFDENQIHPQVMSYCKQIWGRKMKKKGRTIGMDLHNDIEGRWLRLMWAKEASFFCRSLFLFFLCHWKSFRDVVFFLQVYKLEPLFLESTVGWGTFRVRSGISKSKDLEFRKEFPWTKSIEYLSFNKNLA